MSAQSPAPARAATPAQPQRWLLQALAEEVPVYATPDATLRPVSRLERGTQVEADARDGNWDRILRAAGNVGWVLNAPTAQGDTLAVTPLEGEQRLADRAAQNPDEIERARPQGESLEPRLPVIDPSRVEPPTALARRESLPVRDRWRIMQNLNLLPYNVFDPYHPNVLKGDLPVFEQTLGAGWFFNLQALSDTLFEARRLPQSVGVQSTSSPGANGPLGNGRQSVFSQTAIVSFSLIKGNTTFRPPDYEFRFVPVFNFNRVVTGEVRTTNINPGAGTDRNDQFAGVQELFFDKHLRDVSARYDFDSVRVGIQPVTTDFRGFLFLDQPLGLRLFGTRENNRYQYNLGAFRRLEKDTNSGLNDVGQRLRADDVFVANLYRQDTFVEGFTLQGIALYNRNREGNRGQYYNDNGFLERPAILGTGRPRNYDVTYLGANGDGHFGRWNLSASAYYATGRDERGQLSGLRERIGAYFGALELSRDFDWIRLRGTALYASGDKNPYDNHAGGFDAVLENPQIAGADTSYWIRQSIPLIGGGGTALSIRNGVLASLRTSREHGQSNFTNPGLHLFGVGADFDVTPRLRVITNANYLEFDNLSSLATLRNQFLSSTRIGVDLSAAVQYRPLFIQNVVFNASVATLLPLQGLRELYGSAVDARQYSVLANLLLTF